jgi:hypothetical protein
MSRTMGEAMEQRARVGDRSLAYTSLFITFLLHAAAFAPLAIIYGLGGGDDGPPLSDMTVIEASLAYKKNTEKKQPQKVQAPKPVTETPTGVSHEDQKAPVDRPDAGVAKEQSFEDIAKKFQDQREEEDTEEGETVKEGGDFNGSEHGFADVSSGDPWLQELAADVMNAWKLPSLEKGEGDAEGCVHLEPSGRIKDMEIPRKSGNSNIDRSVQLALRDVQKLRDDGAKPVPSHLMSQTTKWTCFKFQVPKEGE